MRRYIGMHQAYSNGIFGHGDKIEVRGRRSPGHYSRVTANLGEAISPWRDATDVLPAYLEIAPNNHRQSLKSCVIGSPTLIPGPLSGCSSDDEMKITHVQV